MSKLTAAVEMHSWSGHGEGGTIARVVIRGGDYGLYHSTPEQIAQAGRDAAEVNAMIANHAGMLKALEGIQSALQDNLLHDLGSEYAEEIAAVGAAIAKATDA